MVFADVTAGMAVAVEETLRPEAPLIGRNRSGLAKIEAGDHFSHRHTGCTPRLEMRRQRR
jgi:hypothetical protein